MTVTGGDYDEVFSGTLFAVVGSLSFAAGDEWFGGQVLTNGPSPITYDLSTEVLGPTTGGTINLADSRLCRCWGSSQANPPTWATQLATIFSNTVAESGTYTYGAISATQKRIMQSVWNLTNTTQQWGHDYYKTITYYNRYREDRSFLNWTDRLTAR